MTSPLSSAAAPAEPAEASNEAPSATVLVVDDEPRNVEVIAGFLSLQGWNVISAPDGETGLQVVRECEPDLVLLDVLMPGMDGFEVCRRLKEDPATVFIPVVILTALRGVQERIKGAEAGADEFLSKPFDHIELITRVRALLRTKRYHDELVAYNALLERKVAERTAELKRALDDVRELDRMKSEFIANVSHELRTPLLHVKGYVDLLGDGAMGALTPKQIEGLAVAEEAVRRLERVVEDVVDFSSLHTSRLEFEPVFVADVCRNVISGAGPTAARRRANLQLVVPPDLPRVRADRVALTRVLRHLVDNAVKFGPHNQLVQIILERRDDRVRVSVRDHGPGMTPSEIERIFDVFYQLDGSITRRAGGLGVGLALVKKLVEAHGSEVEVTSEPGRGSTFSFELPAVS